jgi:hypothetical protein
VRKPANGRQRGESAEGVRGRLVERVGRRTLTCFFWPRSTLFKTRFENEKGTNPEELIAAHAGCFTMALAFQLQAGGYTPTELSTEAAVTLDPEAQGKRSTTNIPAFLSISYFMGSPPIGTSMIAFTSSGGSLPIETWSRFIDGSWLGVSRNPVR